MWVPTKITAGPGQKKPNQVPSVQVQGPGKSLLIKRNFLVTCTMEHVFKFGNYQRIRTSLRNKPVVPKKKNIQRILYLIALDYNTDIGVILSITRAGFTLMFEIRNNVLDPDPTFKKFWIRIQI
jgi:hypothetical protein